MFIRKLLITKAIVADCLSLNNSQLQINLVQLKTADSILRNSVISRADKQELLKSINKITGKNVFIYPYDSVSTAPLTNSTISVKCRDETFTVGTGSLNHSDFYFTPGEKIVIIVSHKGFRIRQDTVIVPFNQLAIKIGLTHRSHSDEYDESFD